MAKQRCRLKVTSLLSSRVVVPIQYYDEDYKERRYFVSVNLRGQDLGGLVCCLVEKITGDDFATPEAFPGTVLKMGLHTVVGFWGLPVAATKDYWLFVAETGTTAAKGGNYSASIEIEVKASRLRELDLRGLAIQYPNTNETVGPSFNAYGTTDNTATLTATMSRGGHVVSTGTVVDGVPEGIWMFQFANVPENTEYAFTISSSRKEGDKVNKESESVTNITVDEVIGEPIEAQPINPPSPPLPPG